MIICCQFNFSKKIQCITNFRFIQFMWTALLVAGLSAAAFGATFTVTKTADTNDGACDADCSSRESVLK